jgi:GTP cyclohydrolase I
MTINDVMTALDVIAPPKLCLGNDPYGLLIGDPEAAVTKIVTTLDVTQNVVTQAKRIGAKLIVAHHPLIFHPIKAIRADEPHPGAVVLACARAGIAVACAHTNWDVAPGGINDVLAALLGLEDTAPLRITHETFGIGRVGTLTTPLTAPALLARIASALQLAPRTLTDTNSHSPIQQIAVCGGAGADLMTDAIAAGASALVTSDVRHHEFVDAAARGFLLIDAGHSATETPGARELGNRLAAALPGLHVTFGNDL